MRTPKLAYVLLAALVGTAFMALVPTAAAQQQGQITVQLTQPSELVKPLQSPLTFQGTVTFTGDHTGYSGIIGIPVSYTVTKQPSWATIIVSPATDIFPIPQSPGTTFTSSRPISIIITATDQAPAFQPEQIEITATTSPTPGAQAKSGKGSVTVTADYFSLIDVQIAESIKVERPQQAVTFPVKVTNFGNANTKVTFEPIDPPAALQVLLPVPVTLQSKQAGGNLISSDVQLQVQTPYRNGYMNEVSVVNYKVTSAYALDPKLKGDESSVSVIVTTKGFYVPGPSPLLVVGLLGLAAVAFRRLR